MPIHPINQFFRGMPNGSQHRGLTWQQTYRALLVLCAVTSGFFVPIHLVARLTVSALLAGGLCLFALGLLVIELGDHGRVVRRRAILALLVAAISTINASALGKTPSQSVAFFFDVLPLLVVVLVLGVEASRVWLWFTCAQVVAAFVCEGLWWRSGVSPAELLGRATVTCLYLWAFFQVCAILRRPIDEALRASSAYGEKLAQANADLERALRFRSEFLANMSHEIRTPLNAVIGTTDLLLRSPLQEEQQEMVHIVRDSGQGLLVILNDILDLAKLESEKMALEQVPVALHRLVFDVLDLMVVRADEKGIELIGDIDPSVPPVIQGDPVRLRQVLINLLGNAVKFTSEGHVLLRVMVGSGPAGAQLRLEVHDSGPGLTNDESARLFQPFTQAHDSIHRTHGGTGLGLVICKRLVALMEGQIGLHSAKGSGSCFWFEVPLHKGRLDLGSSRSWSALRAVLVVARSPHVRSALEHQLADLLVERRLLSDDLDDACEQLRRSPEPPAAILVSDELCGDSAAIWKLHELAPQSSLILVGRLGDEQPAPFRALLARPVRPERLRRALQGLRKPSEAAPEAASAPPASGVPSSSILLVEDNPINQKVISRMLVKLGHQVTLAAHGDEALEKLAQSTYDLIFMDIEMPGRDGLSTTRELRHREGSSQPAIVIALTANAFPEDRQKCIDAGMDDFLPKPIRIEDLESTIARWRQRRTSLEPPRPSLSAR